MKLTPKQKEKDFYGDDSYMKKEMLIQKIRNWRLNEYLDSLKKKIFNHD